MGGLATTSSPTTITAILATMAPTITTPTTTTTPPTITTPTPITTPPTITTPTPILTPPTTIEVVNALEHTEPTTRLKSCLAISHQLLTFGKLTRHFQ